MHREIRDIDINIYERSLREMRPDLMFHISSAGYVKYVMDPIAKNILGLKGELFFTWVTNHLTNTDTEILSRKISNEQFDENRQNVTIKYLIQRLIRTIPSTDNIIYPWVIVKYARISMLEEDQVNPIYRRLYSQIDFDNYRLLPVTFTINGQKHTLSLTMDTTFGIIIFSEGSKFDFHPVMFGSSLEWQLHFNNFPYRNNPEQIENESGIVYTAIVGDETYIFTSPEFIQGFNTGAQWAGVDPHLYITDLNQYTPSSTGEMIATKITF